MQLEEGRTDDARIARDRALSAVAGEPDQETGRAMWRIALRFNAKMREDRSHQGSVLPTRADWEGSSTRVFEG